MIMKQVEIKEKTKLLNADGTLNAKGWSRRCLVDYNKENITPKYRKRLKEWDFYQTSNGHFMVQLNFANITLGAAATASIVNLDTGEKFESSALELFTEKKFQLASKTAEDISTFAYARKGVFFGIEVKEDCRYLTYRGKCKGEPVEIHLVMHHLKDNQSITIVTPFENPNQFFLTTKYNCMATEGFARVGNLKIDFSKEDTFSVLDWGRGVWPHKNYWFWGNASAVIDGKPFGFELTWGIGKEDGNTETCLFYEGVAHKIGKVSLKHHPKEVGYMENWEFEEENGRLSVTMTPFFDNVSNLGVKGVLGMFTHQVHGLFNGTAVLDDGRVITLKDVYAFCEYVENLW